MHVWMYVHICIYVNVFACMCCIFACVCVCLCVCVCTCTCVWMYNVHTTMHAYAVYSICVFVCVCVCGRQHLLYIHRYACMMLVHAYVYICIHTVCVCVCVCECYLGRDNVTGLPHGDVCVCVCLSGIRTEIWQSFNLAAHWSLVMSCSVAHVWCHLLPPPTSSAQSTAAYSTLSSAFSLSHASLKLSLCLLPLSYVSLYQSPIQKALLARKTHIYVAKAQQVKQGIT